jgi:hypothetical protein
VNRGRNWEGEQRDTSLPKPTTSLFLVPNAVVLVSLEARLPSSNSNLSRRTHLLDKAVQFFRMPARGKSLGQAFGPSKVHNQHHSTLGGMVVEGSVNFGIVKQ